MRSNIPQAAAHTRCANRGWLWAGGKSDPALLAVTLLSVGTFLSAGCDKKETIQTYDAPKPADAATNPATPSPGMSATAGDGPSATPPGVGPSVAAAKGPAAGAPPFASGMSRSSGTPMSELPPPVTEPTPATADTVKFLIPPGWVMDPKHRDMRLATLVYNKNGKAAEIVMSQFNAVAGDLLPNVNRWRAMVGLQPVTSVDESTIASVTVAGEKGRMLDLAGPDPEHPQKRMIQVDVPHGGGVLYVKIIGDPQAVAEEKANFDELLKSIQSIK